MLRQNIGWIFQSFYGSIFLFLRMVVTAKVASFRTLKLIPRLLIRTFFQLIVQRAEELLYKWMGILAVEEIVALVPTPVICDRLALLNIMKEQMRRPSKILLSMSIVAFWPLVLFVYVGAEAGFVGVYHEFFNIHSLLMLVKILWKSFIGHQLSHSATFLSAEGKWINFLFFFIKGLDALCQKTSFKWMKLVRRRILSIDDNKRAVKVRWAIHFEMVCKSISLKSIAITF